MTFPVLGSKCAPGILDPRSAGEPNLLTENRAAVDLVRLFALDRLPARRRLVCHWHRQPDGRLACVWEVDIAPFCSADHPAISEEQRS